MDPTSKPTMYWTSRTIASDASEHEGVTLRLLHILLAAPSCSPHAKLLAQYPNVFPLDLTVGTGEEKSPAVKYMLDELTANRSSEMHLRHLTFILPYTSGFIIRSDFLSIRLQLLRRNLELHSFLKPLQHCPSGESAQCRNDLVGMLDTAVGVISLPLDQDFSLQDLENQLHGRLSYPWLSPHPIPERRIALLRGRPNYRVGGPVYAAAKALGVSLVIIDEDKHWLQADTPRNKQLREAFLTIDMKEDVTLPQRIAAAVQSYPAPVHGIFTLSDNYLVAVAQAAERLGLPTCPSSAFEIAYDKGLTRRLHAAPHEYANVKSQEDLSNLLANGTFSPQYPLIVKPRTRGWNSQCVRKIRTETELVLAIQEISPKYTDGVVIEPYYSGPEIDINVVLSNQQTVFAEIVDEPPSHGDDLSASPTADFLENGMRAPSLLPRSEQDALATRVARNLVALGFTTGVFHVEARISHSSMTLQRDEETGSIDLVATTPSQTQTPKNNNDDDGEEEAQIQHHLIEINARPPGLRAQILSKLTYGIDYFGLRMLSALNDTARMKASCHPFHFKPDNNNNNLANIPSGAQAWFQLIHLPVLHAGAAAGLSAFDTLLARIPDDVAAHVCEYQCCFERGDALPDPREYVDVYGHCVVASTQGRRHVVGLADAVLDAYCERGGETVVPAGEQKADVDGVRSRREVLRGLDGGVVVGRKVGGLVEK